MKPIWWIIIIAIAALVVIWLIARAASRKKAESDRVHAEEMRSQADVHDRELRERQAAADEADAKARKAQAEADESNARARQLQAEAERRGEAAHEVRTNRDQTLRQADALDPDVRTDKEGYRLDEHGNRIEERRDGHGAAAAAGAGAAGVGAAGAARATDGMWTDRRDDTLAGDTTRTTDGTTTASAGYDRDRTDGTDGTDWRDRGTTSAGAGAADRDGDGDVGLDDRVENKVDESIGHDDPTRSDVGDGRDGTLEDDRRGADLDGDGRRG